MPSTCQTFHLACQADHYPLMGNSSDDQSQLVITISMMPHDAIKAWQSVTGFTSGEMTNVL